AHAVRYRLVRVAGTGRVGGAPAAGHPRDRVGIRLDGGADSPTGGQAAADLRRDDPMKDYFEALAARIIQPERGVQPRPRAPFEDAGALAPGASDGSSAPVSPARIRSRAASLAERQDSHTPSRRADPAEDELQEA